MLRGTGRLHIGDAVEPLGHGSVFRLHPREVHIVENLDPEHELVVLGIFTPAGSPSAAYLMPTSQRSTRSRTERRAALIHRGAARSHHRRDTAVAATGIRTRMQTVPRNRIANLVDSSAFTGVIVSVILINAIVLGLSTYPSLDESFGDLLHGINDVCFVIFVIELLLRIASYLPAPAGTFFRTAGTSSTSS